MCTLIYHTNIETLQSEGLPTACRKATVDPAATAPPLAVAAAAIKPAATELAAMPAAVNPTAPKRTGARAMDPP